MVLPGAWRSLSWEEWKKLYPGRKYSTGTSLRGLAALVSSKTGKYLWTAYGTSEEPLGMTMFEYGFGEEVRRIMDVDHDGLDDLAVSAGYATTAEPYETTGASLRVLSSRDGATLMWIEARPGTEPRVRVSERVSGTSKPK